MCPFTLYYQFLIVAVALFTYFWLKRQKERAEDNCAAFENHLQSPQCTQTLFGMTFHLQGYYDGRKFGWKYNVFEKSVQIMVSLEPRVEFKLKTFMLTYPKPTPRTFLRGKKIWFCLGSIRRSAFSQLNFGDPVTLVSTSEAKEILDELTSAAKIVETDPLRYA